MSTSSPAQLYCTLVGAVLVIAGIIGFFYSASFDTGTSSVLADTDDVFGILGVNGWHNVVHILIGLLLLACAGTAARSAALGVGLLYLVLAIWGFVESDNVHPRPRPGQRRGQRPPPDPRPPRARGRRRVAGDRAAPKAA